MGNYSREQLEDECGVYTASADVGELVDAAAQGDAYTVHAASVDLRVEAADALKSCRTHGCPLHSEWFEPLRLLEERACAKCNVWVDGDTLCDASDLTAVVAADVCEGCYDELEAETHHERCECAACDQARGAAQCVARTAEARVRGGISPSRLRLLAIDVEQLS
jgi:hypothetical protein